MNGNYSRKQKYLRLSVGLLLLLSSLAAIQILLEIKPGGDKSTTSRKENATTAVTIQTTKEALSVEVNDRTSPPLPLSDPTSSEAFKSINGKAGNNPNSDDLVVEWFQSSPRKCITTSTTTNNEDYGSSFGTATEGDGDVDSFTATLERTSGSRSDIEMIHVITQYYNASLAQKYQIDRALVMNLYNPIVHSIHLLVETIEDYVAAKDVVAKATTGEGGRQENQVDSNYIGKLILANNIPLGKRMTYGNAIQYVNTNTDLHGKVVSIQHADIYLDHVSFQTNSNYLFNMLLPKNSTTTKPSMISLSRHEDPFCQKQYNVTTTTTTTADSTLLEDTKERNLCYQYAASHDNVMFRSPTSTKLSHRIENRFLDFLPNRYGAENVMIWEFQHSGYLNKSGVGYKGLYNPCHDYKIYHVNCNRRFIESIQTTKPNTKPIDKKPFPPSKIVRRGHIQPCSIK